MSDLNIIKKGSYCIIELNRGRANPINTNLIIEIRKVLNNILNDKAIRGIIWKGNTDGFFSVGLDLKELFYYDESQISNFWKEWEEMLIELTSFPKPMIAAVNGYSPAGGCVLAATCDFRVMADDPKYTIGLNELAVGISVPENIFLLYKFWLGDKDAYQALMKGQLFSPQDALSVGLVDDIKPMSEVLPCAEKHLKRMLLATDGMLSASKLNMRRALIDGIQNAPIIPEVLKLKSWFDPSSRAIMEMVVRRLEK
ncbi:MAG: 3,2-trans-enoyl-CoA isomerase [Saprospiraceae bacterium]|jgi:3,2-trans-enoyl-CoA isomerase